MILLSNGKPMGGLPLLTKTPSRQRIVHSEFVILRPADNNCKCDETDRHLSAEPVDARECQQFCTKSDVDHQQSKTGIGIQNTSPVKPAIFFFYNDQLINKAQPVTVELKNVSLDRGAESCVQ